MRAWLVGLSLLPIACGAPAPKPSEPLPVEREGRVAEAETAGATAAAPGTEETVEAVSDAGARLTHAETEEECRRCGGKWGPRGIVGRPGCVCPTRDGGKPCRASRECEHRCELDWAAATALGSLSCDAAGNCVGGKQLPTGRCSADFDIFGCRAWFVEQQTGDGVQIQVRRICVD
jgi:hypothetical protein